MPKFMDHHKTAPLPPEMFKQVTAQVKAGQTDPKTKIKPLYYFESTTDGYCISEAPNAQAVHTYHEALGIKLGAGDVTEVKTAV